MNPVITEAENSILLAIPLEVEIKTTVFSIDIDKAPGPDGLNAAFYQAYWRFLHQDIIKMTQDFFRVGCLEPDANETNLILLPKLVRASKMEEFEPIGLCNVRYKNISKLMVNRIRPLMNTCISKM